MVFFRKRNPLTETKQTKPTTKSSSLRIRGIAKCGKISFQTLKNPKDEAKKVILRAILFFSLKILKKYIIKKK